MYNNAACIIYFVSKTTSVQHIQNPLALNNIFRETINMIKGIISKESERAGRAEVYTNGVKPNALK
jgi:hypothetical protein